MRTDPGETPSQSEEYWQNSPMLSRRLIAAALSVCSLVAAPLKVRAQSNVFGSASPATPVSPTPLVPPEGFTDENGWTWPGTEWKKVSPESEGFSPNGSMRCGVF